MRSVLATTADIATALPAALAAPVVDRVNGDSGTRLRRRAARVPRVASVATAPFWVLVVFRGVLYPAIGADNLEQSWGGPTLVGAWATHLVIGVAALVAVSFLLAALTVRTGRRSTDDAAGRAG